MTGWQWTAGLTGLALLGVTLAPGAGSAPHQSPPAHIPPPIDANTLAPSAATGPVHLDVAVDRQAVLRGRTEERFVTVTLRADAVPGDTPRVPLHLGIVLDTSGSMAEAGKMAEAQRAASHLIGALSPEDRFTLVTFSGSASVPVHAAAPSRFTEVRSRIAGLFPAGGTNLYEGLDQGIRHVGPDGEGRLSRLVVLSDGQATSGITDPGALTRLAREAAAQGVALSTVGLGLDYNEDLLARLADAGSGSYAFVDHASDLTAVFAEELARSASVVARQASVDLVFGPGVEPLELIGWEGVRTEGGWQIPVGELFAGGTRKVVARVRVRAGEAAILHVATASIGYRDLEDEAHSAAAAASVEAAEDAAVAEASVNREVALDAGRAWTNLFFDRSSRAYADGDVAGAQAQLEQMKQAIAATGYAEAFAEELSDAETQSQVYDNASPASSEGKRAIKGAKEKFRDRAR